MASDGSAYVFNDATSTYNLKADSTASTQPLTFTPTVAMAGQALEFSVDQGATWTKHPSGTTGTATLGAGSNVLQIRVTAADAIHKATYEIRVTKTVLASSVTIAVGWGGPTLASNEAKPIDVTFGNSPTDTSVTFTSSDPSVATVTWDTSTARYWISGNKVGNTTITAQNGGVVSNALEFTVTPGSFAQLVFDGRAWKPTFGVPGHSLALAGTSTSLFVLAGQSPEVRRWTGSTWALVNRVEDSPFWPQDPAQRVFLLAVTPDQQLLVANAETIFRWDGSWKPSLTPPEGESFRGLAVTATGTLYVALNSGTLATWSEGLWQTVPPPPGGNVRIGGGDDLRALTGGPEFVQEYRWDGFRWWTAGPAPDFGASVTSAWGRRYVLKAY